jgi:hypothetical protein
MRCPLCFYRPVLFFSINSIYPRAAS